MENKPKEWKEMWLLGSVHRWLVWFWHGTPKQHKYSNEDPEEKRQATFRRIVSIMIMILLPIWYGYLRPTLPTVDRTALAIAMPPHRQAMYANMTDALTSAKHHEDIQPYIDEISAIILNMSTIESHVLSILSSPAGEDVKEQHIVNDKQLYDALSDMHDVQNPCRIYNERVRTFQEVSALFLELSRNGWRLAHPLKNALQTAKQAHSIAGIKLSNFAHADPVTLWTERGYQWHTVLQEEYNNTKSSVEALQLVYEYHYGFDSELYRWEQLEKESDALIDKAGFPRKGPECRDRIGDQNWYARVRNILNIVQEGKGVTKRCWGLNVRYHFPCAGSSREVLV